MNSEEFVEAVKAYVGRAAVDDTIATLKRRSGRLVPPDVKARSDWYNGLSAEEAAHVDSAIDTAVHATLFGLFVVLDGSRKIDNYGGRFELAHLGDQRTVLNDPREIGLHELLNAKD